MGMFASNNTAGQTKVNEVYGELLVPVAKKLDLEFGLRESDYPDSSRRDGHVEGAVHVESDRKVLVARRSAARRARAEHGRAVPGRGPARRAVCAERPVLVHVRSRRLRARATWGDTANNPNRVAVQNLCRAIINNSDADPIERQPVGVRYGRAPARTASRGPAIRSSRSRSSSARATRTSGPRWATRGPSVSCSAAGQPREPDGVVRPLQHQDHGRDRAAQLAVRVSAVLQRGRREQSDARRTPAVRYCGLILRNVQSGERASVDAPFINTGVLKTTGVDVAGELDGRTSARARSSSTR